VVQTCLSLYGTLVSTGSVRDERSSCKQLKHCSLASDSESRPAEDTE
jgi:hypothetical protein